MRILATCVIVAALVSGNDARAEANPGPKGPPQDTTVTGVFSPARLKSDIEAAAKKRETSGTGPSARARFFFFTWSSMTRAEFEAFNRHAVFLFAVLTQKSEWLPVKRLYLRADGKETPIGKVSSWKTPVDNGSITAKMYGTNREDGFYLVPGGAMLRKGEVVMDLAADQTGWVMMGLPSNVASADPRRFPNVDPLPNAKPNLKALQDFVRRKFPGFPVPQSVP